MGYFTPRCLLQTSVLVVVCYLSMEYVVMRYKDKVNVIPSTDSVKSEEKWTQSFQGFNNETGADRFILPNIIHFVRFNQTEYSFIDYVVIKAAMRNHRPDYFYIHTDIPGPGNFTGRYWNLIQKDYEILSRIRLFYLKAPSDILGQPIKGLNLLQIAN